LFMTPDNHFCPLFSPLAIKLCLKWVPSFVHI
jgi:hypothetical protein